jgi:hypothetical protein
MLAAGLAALLALNTMNPEAFVGRRNVEHAQRAGRFDVAYVASLSDDAVPTLVALLPQLDAPERDRLRRAICSPQSIRFTGWAAWNWAKDTAAEARRAVCTGAAGSAFTTPRPP